MESTYRELLVLEREVANAKNSKKEIKPSVEVLGKALRRTVHNAKTTGMIKPVHTVTSSQTDFQTLPTAATATGVATPDTLSILDRIAGQEVRAMTQDQKILGELQKVSSAMVETQFTSQEPDGQRSKVVIKRATPSY